MFKTNPELAKEWERKYGIPKNLPERVKTKHRRRKHA